MIIATGGIGGLFAVLLPKLNRDNYGLKVWGFVELIWFLSYVVATLFKLPIPGHNLWTTVVSNFITSTIFAFTLGWLVNWLDLKTGDVRKTGAKAKPAIRTEMTLRRGFGPGNPREDPTAGFRELEKEADHKKTKFRKPTKLK